MSCFVPRHFIRIFLFGIPCFFLGNAGTGSCGVSLGIATTGPGLNHQPIIMKHHHERRLL